MRTPFRGSPHPIARNQAIGLGSESRRFANETLPRSEIPRSWGAVAQVVAVRMRKSFGRRAVAKSQAPDVVRGDSAQGGQAANHFGSRKGTCAPFLCSRPQAKGFATCKKVSPAGRFGALHLTWELESTSSFMGQETDKPPIVGLTFWRIHLPTRWQSASQTTSWCRMLQPGHQKFRLLDVLLSRFSFAVPLTLRD